MILDIDTAALLAAAGIFVLRVINYSISTIRLVFIGRGMRLLAAMLAFMEALIFAVVMAGVVNDLSNLPNLIAYCLGAAVGSYAGMALESRFIVSYSNVTVFSATHGQAIAGLLRQHNFGVTATQGEGRDGKVDILHSTTTGRAVPHLIELVREIEPEAFVSIEPVRTLQRGWIPGGPPRRRRG